MEFFYNCLYKLNLQDVLYRLKVVFYKLFNYKQILITVYINIKNKELKSLVLLMLQAKINFKVRV